MEYQTEIVGEKGIIKLSGDLISEAAGEALRQAFGDLLARGKRYIVMDFSDVELINSYGVGKVMSCYRQIKAAEGILAVKPLNGFVKDMFELLMLDKLFPVDQ